MNVEQHDTRSSSTQSDHCTTQAARDTWQYNDMVRSDCEVAKVSGVVTRKTSQRELVES